MPSHRALTDATAYRRRLRPATAPIVPNQVPWFSFASARTGCIRRKSPRVGRSQPVSATVKVACSEWTSRSAHPRYSTTTEASRRSQAHSWLAGGMATLDLGWRLVVDRPSFAHQSSFRHNRRLAGEYPSSLLRSDLGSLNSKTLSSIFVTPRSSTLRCAALIRRVAMPRR